MNVPIPRTRYGNGANSHVATCSFPRGGSVMRGWKMVLAAVAAAVVAMPAAAQFGRGGFGGFATPGALLRNPGVQKEIKITEEQLKKYEEFNKTLEPKRQEAQEAFQNMDREKGQEIQKEIAAATDKFIKDTLNADQS